MSELLQRRLVEIGAPEDVLALAAALAEQAVRDPLTGLYNRRFFEEALIRQTETARRYGRALSLVLLDLDHFKQINDTQGHPVGDAVLRETARRLQAVARKADVLCRIGGDEFAAILPETELAGARTLLQRFFREMEKAEPIRVSGGAATLSEEPLFSAADAALRDAKQQR